MCGTSNSTIELRPLGQQPTEAEIRYDNFLTPDDRARVFNTPMGTSLDAMDTLAQRPLRNTTTGIISNRTAAGASSGRRLAERVATQQQRQKQQQQQQQQRKSPPPKKQQPELAPPSPPAATAPAAAKPKRRSFLELGDSELAKVKAVFARIDIDNSGELDFEEVRLGLIEMGCDAETDAVAALIAEYDADGNGTIDLEEFKEIYANTPFGTFNWSHVDHALLAKIEESAKGQHENHAETSDFLRRMGKQGFHVQVSGDNDDW